MSSPHWTDPTRNTQEISMDSTVESGRHPVNTGHLVMGVAFAGLVAIWALISTEAVAEDSIRWLLPLPWVLAGLLGLTVATAASFRGRPTDETAPLSHPDPTNPTEENR